MKGKKYWIAALAAVSAACCLIAAGCSKNEESTLPPPEEGTLTQIELDTRNAQKTFEAGTSFSSDGLLVKASYDNGDVKSIFAADCEFSTPDMNTRGAKTVYVTYRNKSATYEINVIATPKITAAQLVEEGGVLYAKVTGTAVTYRKEDIGFNLQKLNADDYVSPACTVSVTQSGAFELLANVGAAAMENAAYMLHVTFEGQSKDVVDLPVPADSANSFGGKYYQLQSEKCFDNNESLFAVLRRGNSAENVVVNPVSTVSVAQNGDKLQFIVTGKACAFSRGNFSLELREAWSGGEGHEWGGDAYYRFPLTKMSYEEEDGVFTYIAEAALSSFHADKIYFLRYITDFGSDEIYNLEESGRIKQEIVIENTKYTFEGKQLYDAKMLTTITLSAETE